MIFSNEPVDLEIPGHPGNFLQVVRVPWTVMRDAREAAGKKALESARILGAEVAQALKSKGGAEEAQKLVERNKYHPDNYDTEILLEAGIKGWHGPDCDGVDYDLLKLDERTAEAAKEKVISLTCPSEEERKND